MSDLTDKYFLPRNIERYIASLELVYRNQNQEGLREILVNSRISIEPHSFDSNLEGEITGFLLRLMVPSVIFSQVIHGKEKYEEHIRKNLNRLITIRGEFISCISIEMELNSDEDWRYNSGCLLSPTKIVASNAISRIWGSGNLVKLFISHKANYKQQVSDIKMCLDLYGISCFVAHQDIQPTKEWQDEIENALLSMDALVAFMTEDFHDSEWTDQEVGVAIGRGVPLISVKIGKDPYGFIGKYQAMNGSLQETSKTAVGIYEILINHTSLRNALYEIAIQKLRASRSFEGAHFIVKKVLPHFKTMNNIQVGQIQDIFQQNDQLYKSVIVRKDLPGVLNELTGKRYHIKDKDVIEDIPQTKDAEEVPF